MLYDEADAKVTETRSRLFREINEYMHLRGQELGRPHHIMVKMWQMMQSNDTKTKNLDMDFEEMVINAKQKGWDVLTKTTRFWAEEEEQDPQSKLLYAQTCR